MSALAHDVALPPPDATQDRPAARAFVANGQPDYAALRGALLRAVGRVCPPWLAEQREDIVQVAMTKLLRILEHGKDVEDIRPAYVARLAYHAVVDEIRRQRRRKSITALDDVPEGAAVDPAPSPEQTVQGSRLGEDIRDCMTKMARSRRLAVGLYLEGRGATEVAGMFDWKRKQADNLIHRGIADLRRCLTGKGLQP